MNGYLLLDCFLVCFSVYLRICIYMCVCVCVCVSVFESVCACGSQYVFSLSPNETKTIFSHCNRESWQNFPLNTKKQQIERADLDY